MQLRRKRSLFVYSDIHYYKIYPNKRSNLVTYNISCDRTDILSRMKTEHPEPSFIGKNNYVDFKGKIVMLILREK